MSRPSKVLRARLSAFIDGLIPEQRQTLHDLLSYENTTEALWFVLDCRREQDECEARLRNAMGHEDDNDLLPGESQGTR